MGGNGNNNIKEIERNALDLILLAADTVQWRAALDMVMKLLAP